MKQRHRLGLQPTKLTIVGRLFLCLSIDILYCHKTFAFYNKNKIYVSFTRKGLSPYCENTQPRSVRQDVRLVLCFAKKILSGQPGAPDLTYQASPALHCHHRQSANTLWRHQWFLVQMLRLEPAGLTPVTRSNVASVSWDIKAM